MLQAAFDASRILFSSLYPSPITDETIFQFWKAMNPQNDPWQKSF